MTTKLVAKIEADQCCPSVLVAPLAEDQAVDLAAGFAALSDPVRLRLVSLLATAPDGAVCACDLVEPLGKSQPTISHHLKVLTEAALIVGERQGKWIWYRVLPERLDALRKALAE